MEMPSAASQRAQILMRNAALAQQEFQSFVRGVQLGMGLEGAWSLDTNTWEFTKVEPQEAEEVVE